MPPRQPHDPFTDAPLRPTTGNPILRAQASQQSLRSNASTASSRTRQQRDLFAPALSRRPTSRTTPRVEDEVLADPDSEEELAAQRQRQLRKIRQGSPEGKYSRARARQEEEVDIVNRQPNGNYLLDVSASNEAVATQLYAPEVLAGKAEANTDAYYVAVARQYFTSGTALGGRAIKKPDDDTEELVGEMMAHLRRQALQKLDEERWLFEPLDRYQPQLP